MDTLITPFPIPPNNMLPCEQVFLSLADRRKPTICLLRFNVHYSPYILTHSVPSETWSLKTTKEKKLDASDTRCLRKMLGIRWSDFISNDEVRKQSSQPPVSSMICKRRLNWLGHVSRLPPSRPAHQVLWWTPTGQRKRGRPKMNWRQTVDRDLQLVSRRWSDVRILAADRARWSTWTASCGSRRGSV